jgi:probable phosphoglycerate mutase
MHPPQLILVRHGQTDWTFEDRRLGSSDIPLNPTGYMQAEAIGRFLRGYPIARVLHTGMQRTISMANIIQTHTGGVIEVEKRLQERDYGTLEGTVRESIGGVDSMNSLPAKEATKAGIEPITALSKRVLAAYKDIRKQTLSESRDTIIIGHLGPIRLLLAHALSLDVEGRRHFEIAPGSVSSIRLLEDFDQVTLLNMTSFFS